MEDDDFHYAKKLQWSLQQQQHDDDDTEIYSSLQYGTTSAAATLTKSGKQHQVFGPNMLHAERRVQRTSQATQDQIYKDAEIALRLQLQYQAEIESETDVYQAENENETHVVATI